MIISIFISSGRCWTRIANMLGGFGRQVYSFYCTRRLVGNEWTLIKVIINMLNLVFWAANCQHAESSHYQWSTFLMTAFPRLLAVRLPHSATWLLQASQQSLHRVGMRAWLRSMSSIFSHVNDHSARQERSMCMRVCLKLTSMPKERLNGSIYTLRINSLPQNTI